MSTPTPILDSSDSRWIELEAYIVSRPDGVWKGPGVEEMSPDERGEAHDYFIRGIGHDDRDGISGEVDACMTLIGLLRIMSGSSPDPVGDPDGSLAAARLYGRFDHREHLLFEELLNFTEFLERKLGLIDAEALRPTINEYFDIRKQQLAIE